MIRRFALIGTAVAAGAILAVPSASASASAAKAPAPAKVANALFDAWAGSNRVAASRVATPAAVNTLFAYPWRTPDEFAGCNGNACRFVHTSVRVPGGLNGMLMVVSGSKVTRLYTSRHLAAPSAAAKRLFAAWKRNDRYAALEAATTTAVRTMFRTRYDARYHYQGCSAEPKGYSCAWSYEGGAMLMHVGGRKPSGYEVRSISYIAD